MDRVVLDGNDEKAGWEKCLYVDIFGEFVKCLYVDIFQENKYVYI